MPFDLQPFLSGVLVTLRPLQADDLGRLYQVASDPLIWAQHPVKDRAEQEGFARFFEEQLASGGGLLVFDGQTREVIGTSRFHAYDEEHSEIEIGCTFLARSHWRGVYNAELKELMLRDAFRFVQSVVFLVDPGNLRSLRAVKKLGAVEIGARPNAHGGASVAYRIDRAAFAL